jgi:hypothetical protein
MKSNKVYRLQGYFLEKNVFLLNLKFVLHTNVDKKVQLI